MLYFFLLCVLSPVVFFNAILVLLCVECGVEAWVKVSCLLRWSFGYGCIVDLDRPSLFKFERKRYPGGCVLEYDAHVLSRKYRSRRVNGGAGTGTWQVQAHAQGCTANGNDRPKWLLAVRCCGVLWSTMKMFYSPTTGGTVHLGVELEHTLRSVTYFFWVGLITTVEP